MANREIVITTERKVTFPRPNVSCVEDVIEIKYLQNFTREELLLIEKLINDYRQNMENE